MSAYKKKRTITSTHWTRKRGHNDIWRWRSRFWLETGTKMFLLLPIRTFLLFVRTDILSALTKYISVDTRFQSLCYPLGFSCNRVAANKVATEIRDTSGQILVITLKRLRRHYEFVYFYILTLEPKEIASHATSWMTEVIFSSQSA
jgi:hypothetical protein